MARLKAAFSERAPDLVFINDRSRSSGRNQMYAIKRRIYMIGTGWVASAGALIYTAGEKSKPITSPAAGRVRVIRHLFGLISQS